MNTILIALLFLVLGLVASPIIIYKVACNNPKIKEWLLVKLNTCGCKDC